MLLNLKDFKWVSAVAVLIFISANVAADDTNKIAVVDSAIAIFGSATAQAKLKAAEESADFLSLKAKYESSTADLQTMAKEAESQRFTWSQEQLAEHQKKMGYAKADAELTVQKIKAEQQQLQQSILQELGPLAEQAIQEIVQELDISLLLRAESVLLAAPDASITAKVASRIDQKVAAIKKAAEAEQAVPQQ
jgi:outer membrane protein